jgi:hypothetical protein
MEEPSTQGYVLGQYQFFSCHLVGRDTLLDVMYGERYNRGKGTCLLNPGNTQPPQPPVRLRLPSHQRISVCPFTRGRETHHTHRVPARFPVSCLLSSPSSLPVS